MKLFDLQVPWWEFIVRAAVVYSALLVLVRLTGKRTVGQFTPFDLIVVMLLSEAVSGSLNAQDHSMQGGLISACTLVLLNVIISIASARYKHIGKLVEGCPVLIGRDGVIYDDILHRERVPRADVEEALRSADCEIEDMRMAILEADGAINILKKHAA